MRKFLVTCGLIALACVAPSLASAQNRNNTGSGNTGSGNTGSSGFGTTGSSPFGNTGSSGMGGLNSTGGNGLGSSGFGGQNGLGTNGQSGFGGQNQLGANGNNGGILGRNTNQNQFLGRNVQNQGVGGNNNLGGGRGGGGNRRNNGADAMGGGGANAGNANQAPVVRPRQKVAFDYPQPKTDAIQITLETRLTKLSVKSPGLKSIMVAVEDKGEVILRGEVRSSDEAKLAENLLRLEPGVRTVRNELTFPAAASTEE